MKHRIMKHKIRKKCSVWAAALAAAPLTLLFGLVCVLPAMAEPSGHLDWADRHTIAGWSWDEESPEETMEVTVDITPAGSRKPVKTMTVTAETHRDDLVSGANDGDHGFFCPIDWTQLSGDSFTVTAYVRSGDEKIPLTGTVFYDTSSEKAILAVPDAGTADPVSQISDEEEAPASSDEPLSDSSSSETEGNSSSGDTAESTGWKRGESLGYFITTGYCNCVICSGGSNLTYSGTVPQPNHTISADLSVFPIGTKLMIGDIVYTVEDKGSGVHANNIDIFYSTHEEAVAHGQQTMEVFAVIAE